jgi:hypothetical protein
VKCGRCTDPTYCACADFFASWRAYWSGAMDDRMTSEQIAERDARRPAQPRALAAVGKKEEDR